MAKRPTTVSVGTGFASGATQDANNAAIEAAFDNTVSRDGSTPNQMEADFDLNNNDILNGGTVNTTSLILNGVEVLSSSAVIDADSLTNDLKLVKTPCRVTSTSNITLSGEQTIDSVSVVAGDRVLVNGQTDASENGIYVCAAGAWARSVDFESSSQLDSGLLTSVSEGSSEGDTVWILSTNDPIDLGTTNLSFTKVTAAAGGVTDPGLISISNLTTAADTMIYTTALDTYTTTTLTAAGRALLDDADAAAQRTTLGLTDAATSTITAAGQALIDDADASAQRTTLGLGSAAVANLLDEDDMASDSATAAASQQSIKAYVDNTAGGPLAEANTAIGTGPEYTLTGIPSTAKHVIIWLKDVETGLGVFGDLWLRVGDSGGIETTGYDSVNQHFLNTTTPFGFQRGIIHLVNISGNTWNIVSDIYGVTSSSVFDAEYVITTEKTTSGTLDRIQLRGAAGIAFGGSGRFGYKAY